MYFSAADHGEMVPKGMEELKALLAQKNSQVASVMEKTFKKKASVDGVAGGRVSRKPLETEDEDVDVDVDVAVCRNPSETAVNSEEKAGLDVIPIVVKALRRTKAIEA
ncbi:hypothetical protein NE237_026768 [Protea cynaroides]|uniref:Uncharacterized protein n=1 Tax=Protea cynaroides TaxID=273540 RepID=A0A9Q0JT59_9MAGN|nr:hypothetical protein NE237_026768 [Protea cynaroides]